jgi:hypothetical protein
MFFNESPKMSDFFGIGSFLLEGNRGNFQPLPVVLLVQLFEPWNLLDARPAPASPQFNKNDLILESFIVVRDVDAIEVRKRKLHLAPDDRGLPLSATEGQ